MAWSSTEQELAEIEEPNAGDGIESATILAKPGEKIQIDLERTDTSPSEEWRAAIEVSTGTNWSDPPVRNRRLKSTQLTPSFLLSGYYGYRIWIENDAVTPSEKVKAIPRYRKDGVNI